MKKEYIYLLNSSIGELELQHSPIGWDSAENMLSRSEDFDGVFNEYSLNPLEFTKDGMFYLMDLFKLEGINLVCTITELRFDYKTQTYGINYDGVLNGSSYNELDNNGGCISINIGESEVHEKVLARKDNVINYDNDIGIDGNELTIPVDKYVDLYIQGHNIISKGTVRFEEGVISTYPTTAHYLAPSILIESSNENTFSPNLLKIYDLDQVSSRGWWYETNDRSSKLTIDLVGAIRTSLDNGMEMIFVVGDKLVPDPEAEYPVYLENITTVHQISIEGNNPNQFVNIDESFVVEMTANQAFYLYFTYAVTPPNPVGIIYNVQSLEGTLTFSELPAPKTIKAITPFNLFQRIAESITGKTGIFESELLTDSEDYKNVLSFNGYMARGYTEADSKYADSLVDYFDTFRYLSNTGLAIEDDVISLRPLEELYKDSISITIDQIKQHSWDRKIESSLFLSSIESGYENTEYDEESGLEEYNNKSIYNSPINRVATKKLLVMPNRGDGYGITFAVEQSIEESETTDTQYDSSNFFLSAKPLGEIYIQKGREEFVTVTGIDQIEYPMNLDFTPARVLVKNSELLTTGLDKTESKTIQFSKPDVSNDLATKKATEQYEVSENSDIELFKLKDPRFSGFYINFDAGGSFEVFKYLKEHRYDKIEVLNPMTKQYHYGWLLDVKRAKNNNISFKIAEQYNGTNTNKLTIMIDDLLNLVITDKNEKILVNE